MHTSTTRTRTVSTLIAGVALGLAAAVPFVATAQPDKGKDGSMSLEDAMQMDPAAIMEAMQAAAAPDEHHEFLAKLAGDFTMKMKFWMQPGAPPEVSTGKCTAELVMDGRYLVCDVDMTFGFAGMSIPMQGKSIMGYSKPLGEYQTFWIDTMNTNMTTQSGQMKDGVLTVVGDTATPWGPSKLKNIFTLRDGGYDLEFHEPNPMTGEMMKTGVIEYRKVRG